MKTQTTPFNIAVLVGSLRAQSLSLKMAHALRQLAPASLNLTIIAIGELPMYNEDLETDMPPAAWQLFRDTVRVVDGVLFVTPEYNRSIPAVLKNAIDVGSAPHGSNVFAGKPAAIVSLSPGRMGAFGANHHLRQCLVFLDMPTMQQPEAYIGGSEALFDADDQFICTSTRSYLASVMTSFAGWAEIYSLRIRSRTY